MLIISKDNFEVTSIFDTYTLEDIFTDITTLDIFKNNDAYKSYISIVNIRYHIVNDELITIAIKGYDSVVSDGGSEYYKFLEHLSINNSH